MTNDHYYEKSSKVNRIGIRLSDSELEKLDEMCKYYKTGRSEILRGTAMARYRALVKKGEIKDI
jgi:metal-responsive CopG/Arc/MetJ family transcriptional regulator